MTKFLRDTRLMFVRNFTITLRNPVWVFVGMFQPVLYLLLFAPLLNKLSMPGFEDTKSLNVFTPGLLVMMALFGVGFAGFSVIEDLRSGVVERLRVTPANRMALLLGMMLRDVVIFLIQCAILFTVAILMGLDANLEGLLLVFGLMAILGLMMASLSYGLAMLIRDEGGLAATLSTITLPLLLLSGVMLPMTLAPKWMQTLSDFNPFSHIVDANRALVNGNLGDNAILLGFAVVAALAVLMLWWASNVFREATA